MQEVRNTVESFTQAQNTATSFHSSRLPEWSGFIMKNQPQLNALRDHLLNHYKRVEAPHVTK